VEPGKFFVRGNPSKAKTIQEIALRLTPITPGMEAGLEAVSYYYPPNLTYPFGSYICVVDIDKGTGEVKIRRFVAVDDCGNIINPMIVEGQIHGGLTMGLAPAMYEEISYDEVGNIQGGSFMDYLVPTAVETPKWETDKTCTPSPHHPLGAKGVASRLRWVLPRLLRTPLSMRCGIWACATSISRSLRQKSGSACASMG
jgi:carbon-monoxide dehydrogenase large subunit